MSGRCSRLARLTMPLLAAVLPVCAFGDDRAESMVAEAVDAYRIGMDSPQEDERIEQFAKAHRLFAQVAEEGDACNADL